MLRVRLLAELVDVLMVLILNPRQRTLLPDVDAVLSAVQYVASARKRRKIQRVTGLIICP